MDLDEPDKVIPPSSGRQAVSIPQRRFSADDFRSEPYTPRYAYQQVVCGSPPSWQEEKKKAQKIFLQHEGETPKLK